MADEKPNWWQSHRVQIMRMGTSILAVLGSSKVRWIYVFLGLVVIAWLTVTRVIGTLQKEASLPPGVTPSNPTLERSILEKIEQNRIDRSTYFVPSYEPFNRFFVTSSSDPKR